MPILQQAKKKLRADRKKKAINKVVRSKAFGTLKRARKEPSAEKVTAAFSAIDRAAKKRVFHPSKADRLKSRLSGLLVKSK